MLVQESRKISNDMYQSCCLFILSFVQYSNAMYCTVMAATNVISCVLFSVTFRSFCLLCAHARDVANLKHLDVPQDTALSELPP